MVLYNRAFLICKFVEFKIAFELYNTFLRVFYFFPNQYSMSIWKPSNNLLFAIAKLSGISFRINHCRSYYFIYSNHFNAPMSSIHLDELICITRCLVFKIRSRLQGEFPGDYLCHKYGKRHFCDTDFKLPDVIINEALSDISVN